MTLVSSLPFGFQKPMPCPGRIGQLVKNVIPIHQVCGSIPAQGTDKNQAMNASISGTTNKSMFLSPFPNIKKIKPLPYRASKSGAIRVFHLSMC